MSEDKIDSKDNLSGHEDVHEYDGIKELNNPAPYWVILLFFATIAFAGIYAIKYFGYPNNGLDQASEYKASVEEQKLNMKSAAGGPAGAMSESDIVAAGQKLYSEKGCIACHGTKGEGNAIGPNLCDNFWINGCKPEDVAHTISEGKPEKGMTPFKASLSEAQITQISTFILKSLAGSNPSNAKAAQGVECK
jgi:cytochrome c oxidase cbb3-type subunit III